ncbi:hypothetical protein P175DRAFT_0487303 [Aspergillus ochraceoroseus IBT 24754]|uniref:Transcription factor domain-containing protein n=1 Tax=Aspergillus ochraceoroseus IBT 24754 TaxID=1392256 RepID=A0A2T5LMU5_9EURO|nr:uncharacterized protein P175DRAFT_0487303 [Aspergillus ochraceoroseus IBT 24754]PTU17596.1 hypothetical protein P175DRAFT_0487303 [Aspergillus ochraceoroseus IBT 24754]
MFGLEPPQKRQRLDPTPHASPEPEHTGQPTQPPADNKSTPTVKAWNQSQNPPPSGYQGPSHPSPRPAGAGEPLYSPPNSRYQDGFSQDPGFLASQEELRSILFTFANSAAPTRASSPEADRRDLADTGSASRGYHSAQRGSVPPPPSSARTSPLSSRRRIEYLKNYVAEIAPWLDMFDSRYTFRQQLPALAHSFPALSYAILAISARQMERKSGTQDWCDSLELYQEATRLLSPLLQVCDPKIVAACVLLCCLEMMSARAQDWHRHLEGCAALFDAFGIHGFSQGLLQAVFWCYARMDLCGALISDGTRTTLLHPSKWLPAECQEEDAYRLFKEARSPDMHANYAVYLCMKTTELGANRTKFVELGEENGCTTDVFSSRWTQLWNDLQTWLAERPSELLPVQTLPRKPFPQILFVHWAAISSNQLYHTACILLLKMMPKSLRLTRSHNLSLLWHARRICGISLSNKHHGCLNNAIQPLWIAGRLFSHASEHEQIIKIIRDVEAETGWGACWRIRDLELAWGYNPRRDTANFPSQQFSAPIDQEIVAS